MDADIARLDELNDSDLIQQIREDAQHISEQAPLDDDWDDPEFWVVEGVRLAYAVKLLYERHPVKPASDVTRPRVWSED